MWKSISCLLLAIPLVAGQQVFRSGTDLVEVDVVVLDSAGRLVRGLTAADFELFDEGKPQDVSTFAFIEAEASAVETSDAVWSEPGLSSSVAHRSAAVYLIVIDHLFSPPQRRDRVRAAARDFVRHHMRPGDLAAVVHLGQSTQGVEFSGSTSRLIAAIDGIGDSAGYSGQNPTPPIGTEGTPGAQGSAPPAGGKGRAPASDKEVFNLDPLVRMESLIEASLAEQSYEMLGLAAQYVSGFTGRRKSMLLFSSGVPIDLTGTSEPADRFRRAHARLVEQARQSNVAVYAIDTQGLNSEAYGAGAPLGGHNEGPPERSVFALPSTMAVQNKADALRALAGETGGRAILRYNEMATPFAQIARDNGSFYLLGFRPASADTKKFRRLEVRVKRNDVQVFARLGYGGDAKGNAKMGATLARAWEGRSVADLLDRPLPGRSFGLPMRASASVISRSAKSATALLVVEVDAGAIPANATRVDVGYRAIGTDGTPAASRVVSTRMQLTERTRAAIDANGWRYMTTIDLPPAAYQLRVAAREEASGAYGTVFLDVEVADPARVPLAIDAVLIGSSTSAATPTASQDRGLLQTWPVLPTTRRDFSQAETLVAFVHLSGARSGAASVRVEVEGPDGRPIAGSTYEAGAATRETGAAPVAHQVPLSAFAPGAYVMTISATAPGGAEAAAVRRVPFTVRRDEAAVAQARSGA